MTQVQSNAHRVEIVAPSGGGSSLATISAATTPGTWAAWTGGNLSAADTNPAGADPVTSYSLRAVWDVSAKKFYFYGHGHTGHQSRMLTFNDATSAWSSTNSGTNVPLADNGGADAHQFTGFAGNPANGFLFFYAGNGGGGGAFRRPAGSNAWASVSADPAGSHGQIAGAAFNPNVGSQGSVVLGSQYGVEIYDVAGNSWSQNWHWSGNGGGTDPSGDPPFTTYTTAFWSPRANAVYIGDTAMVKIATSGAHSRVSDSPIHLFAGQTDSAFGEAADGYVSTLAATTGRTRRPVVLVPGSNMYRYNETEDTWTTLGVAPPAFGGANAAGFYAVVPDYDGIALWVQQGSTGNLSAYFYRHPTADEI